MLKWWVSQTPDCFHLSFEAVFDEEVEAKMSWLEEECGARDFILCQEDRGGEL